MPNKVKFNRTGSEANSVFKGDWAVDVSSPNTGGGPTSTTGFYNGVDVPAGGYAIYYENTVFTANNSTQLLEYINTIGGDSSNLTAALYWAAQQSNIMILSSNFESIVTDGLQFAYDQQKLDLVRLNDSTGRDFSVNQYDISLPPAYNYKAYTAGGSWMNSVSEITIQVLLEKIGTGTGYANHPVAKWNSGGTSTASFVLYHFENYQNNGADGRIGYYANTSNSGWTSLTNQYRMSVGERVLVTLAYGGGDTHYWINDTLYGVTSNRGLLAPTVTPSSGFSRNMEYSAIHGHGTSQVHQLLMYNRRLSTEEILQNHSTIIDRL